MIVVEPTPWNVTCYCLIVTIILTFCAHILKCFNYLIGNFVRIRTKKCPYYKFDERPKVQKGFTLEITVIYYFKIDLYGKMKCNRTCMSLLKSFSYTNFILILNCLRTRQNKLKYADKLRRLECSKSEFS
jgi:hypothetical protein